MSTKQDRARPVTYVTTWHTVCAASLVVAGGVHLLVAAQHLPHGWG
jgi:hypothetical protein